MIMRGPAGEATSVHKEEMGCSGISGAGRGVALNAGYLVSRVLDIVKNGETQIAILDASAACHMPDVLEMPYQPPIYNAVKQPDEGGQYQHRYRLAGMSLPCGRCDRRLLFSEGTKSWRYGNLRRYGNLYDL